MNRCMRRNCTNFVGAGFRFCRRNDCADVRGEEE